MNDQQSDPEYCAWCGFVEPRSNPGFCRCIAVLGSSSERADLIAAARDGDPAAARQISDIRDGSHREALEAIVLENGDRKLVEGAASALANIASEASMPVMKDLADRAWMQQLAHAIRFLGRVATPEAVETLATALEQWPLLATRPLVLLGDSRGIEALMTSLRPRHERFHPQALPLVLGLEPGTWASELIDVLEEAADVERTVESAVLAHLALRARRRNEDPPRTIEEWQSSHQDEDEARWVDGQRRMEHRKADDYLRRLMHAISQVGGETGAAAVNVVATRTGVAVDRPDTDRGRRSDQGEATARAWSLDYALGDPDHPGTRFGGQPTWIQEPTWPLTPAGTPMAFWAQIRVPDSPEQMAYVFVDRREGPISSEDGTACVFLQPGGEPDVRCLAMATGPVVPDQVDRDDSYGASRPWSLAARVPTLRPFSEPAEWGHDAPPGSDESWDKVGGTPLHLQGDPHLDDYDFLCQFTAADAGEELADGAQCYVYVNPRSGSGYFYWDCH